MTIEQLQPFCSTDKSRVGIVAPFTKGGWTYATNGRIMIRVPAIPGVEDRPGTPINPEKVLPGREVCGTPVELPPGWGNFPVNIKTCKRCGGGGRTIRCRHCDGEGHKPCPTCLHDEDCDECGALGFSPASGDNGEPCEGCCGLGTLEDNTPVVLNRGAMEANLPLLRLASTLPGLRMFHGGKKVSIRLEFEGGGEGALAGLNDHRESHAELIAQQWPAPAAAAV
jgi:hypothetical protein